MGIQSGPELGQGAEAFIPPRDLSLVGAAPGKGVALEEGLSADGAISEGHQRTLSPARSQPVSPEPGGARGHRHDSSRQQDRAHT